MEGLKVKLWESLDVECFRINFGVRGMCWFILEVFNCFYVMVVSVSVVGLDGCYVLDLSLLFRWYMGGEDSFLVRDFYYIYL